MDSIIVVEGEKIDLASFNLVPGYIQELKFLVKTRNDLKKWYNYWRDDSLNQEEMSKILGLSQPYIVSVLDKIVDRVTKKFEEIYEDWYYLNLVKGKYKKCSCCGKIKLANERYFRKHPNTKDGFQSQCRKCEQIMDKSRKI